MWNYHEVGLYVVVTIDIGLTVVWDKKTTVIVKLEPKYKVNAAFADDFLWWLQPPECNAPHQVNSAKYFTFNQGQVCGLCGNFDDNQNNDEIKSVKIQAVTPSEFGKSLKVRVCNCIVVPFP